MQRLGPLLFGLAGLCALLAGCGGDGEQGAVGAASQIAVAVTQRDWTDTTRATPPTSHFPGAPERQLRTLVWLPDVPEPLPLLVLAHGFGGLPLKFDAFARAVATAGFVVAAPAFPLTNENAPGGHDAGLGDVVSQPGDVSFVITQLLAEAATPGTLLADHVRASDVAVLGHSLGGVTAIALTRKSCCRDTRVRAAIFVSAPALPLTDAFFPGLFDPNGPPTMVMQGTDDATVPYATALALYAALQPPRVLIGLSGTGHSEALESQAEPPIPARRAAQTATVGFLNAILRGDRAALDAALAQLTADGNIVQADARE
jgi:pimeloyl-ACP methyl ester carboxylesterase